MDNEKIKELAERYVKEVHYDDFFLSEATRVIQWLFKTHCIVEKSKIKALYSKMELDGNHVDSDNDWAVYEAMDELEKIFGKELFNTIEK